MTDITALTPAPTHTAGILQQPQPQEDDFNNDVTDDFEVDLFDDAFENKVVKSKEVKDKEVAETEIVNKVINDSIKDDLVDGLVDESVGESIDELLADEHSESLYEPINELLNQPPLADELSDEFSNEPSDESSELTESTELSGEQTDEADNKPELPDDFLAGIDTSVPKHKVLTYKELEEFYVQKRELQKKNLQRKAETVENDSVIEVRIQDDEESSFFDRLFFGVLMAFVFAMIGFILDGLITVMRSVAGHGDGSLVWMFAPILAVIGLFLGVLSGRNAGVNAIEFIDIGHSANTRIDDPSVVHDVLRGVSIAVAIFAVGWIASMLLI